MRRLTMTPGGSQVTLGQEIIGKSKGKSKIYPHIRHNIPLDKRADNF